ncbi:MAG: Unknown protein [uncultured Thiotrichaceae bacterium]|uniref:YcgL domain-containing protein n=1 Tax=uncultured Thiotrichaceae bacterium TaxID=298394 RepID=A0A6S6S039_9GAMM|nr:MAG: Unknown protein [uncultured Thiotrichaceae bacterium]
MHVYIYRCKHRKETFLYIPEKDNFEEVPDSLLGMLGETAFSFDFDLDDSKKLIRAAAPEVIRNIQENGYFLQLPLVKDEKSH